MGLDVDLRREVALVTGGSRNIGLAIAEAYRDAGARVCIVARADSKQLETALERLDPTGADAMGALVDVADESAVRDLYDRIAERFAIPSLLVNAAATRPHEPFTEISRASWSTVLETILTGAFLTSRELFRRLPEERRGSIINIGGLSAHRPRKDRVHVIAAKSGLVGLTRALAEEGLGRIRVNSVVPGAIATERRPGQSSPHAAEDNQGTSDDVARAVLALSDPRDVYVTGQTLHVSGGRFMP